MNIMNQEINETNVLCDDNSKDMMIEVMID